MEENHVYFVMYIRVSCYIFNEISEFRYIVVCILNWG